MKRWLDLVREKIIRFYLAPLSLTTIRNLPPDLNRIRSPFAHVHAAVKLLRRIPKAEDFIIVDVGAARGDACSRLARAFPQTKIIVFEPLQKWQKRLASLARRFPNVTIIAKAVSDKAGPAEMTVAGNLYSSSLLDLDVEYNHTVEIGEDLTPREAKERVEITTLDEELAGCPPIGLLKLDIQGAELKALRGASAVLRHTSIVLVEMGVHGSYVGAAQYHEVDAYLRSLQFELYNVIPALHSRGRIYEWDAIYLNAAVGLT